MSQPRHGILSLSIKDVKTLYTAYMPFVRNGGLFIPTDKPYKLGAEVFMLLTLLDGKSRLPVAGKVIWITPPRAQNNKATGIGVQFSEQDGGTTKERIESQLKTLKESNAPTHTM